MNILAINTSSYRLGIALLKDDLTIGVHETYVKVNQSTRAMPAIERLLKDVHMNANEIDQIVVAEGPGSFTGIRIGVTIAKTMAWALNIPIIGVSTLQALAYQGVSYEDKVLVPFFDARRKRVYSGAYMWGNGELTSVIKDKNVEMELWLKELQTLGQELVFLSPDLEEFRLDIRSICHEQAIFPSLPFHRVDPVHVALVGKMNKPEQVHTFVPKYLRMAEAEKKWLEEQGELLDE